jgi:hypothetical protein
MITLYYWSYELREWIKFKIADATRAVAYEKRGYILRIPEEMKEKGDKAPDLWEFWNAFKMVSQKYVRRH